LTQHASPAPLLPGDSWCLVVMPAFLAPVFRVESHPRIEGTQFVPRNPAVAAEWYRKAAEAGEPAGEFNLGDLYLQGEGVPQNDSSALEWFEKAAAQGHRRAQAMMGFLYAAGRGVPKDLEAAYAWTAAAQSAGEPQIQDAPSLAEIERQLSPDAIQRAKGRAQVLAKSFKQPTTAALLY